MKRSAFFIQLVSVAVLAAIVLLVTVGRGWLRGDELGAAGRTREAGAPASGPAASRVFYANLYANLGPVVAVLAPLHRERKAAAFDAAWLDRTLGYESGRHGYLFLHLFHRGHGGAVTIDPSAMRTALRTDETWGALDRPLGPAVAGLIDEGKVTGSAAAYLRTVAPAAPFEVPVNGVTRLLLAFDRAVPWPRIEGARLRLPAGADLVMRTARISDVNWELLLSGGLIPDALATDVQLEASLPRSK